MSRRPQRLAMAAWVCASLGVVSYVAGAVHAQTAESLAEATRVHSLLRLASCSLATVGVLAGYLLHRPRHAAPWLWLLATCATYTLRPLVSVAAGPQGLEGPVAAVLIVLTAGSLVTTAAMFVRARHLYQVTDARFEIGIVVLSFAAYHIPLDAIPAWQSAFILPTRLALGIAAPVCYVLLAALLGLLLFIDVQRSRAFQFLSLGLGLSLIIDGISAIDSVGRTVLTLGLLDIYPLSSLLYAAAALHPTMASLTEPADQVHAAWSGRRSVILLVALLLPMVALATDRRTSLPEQAVSLGLAAVAGSLVLARARGAVVALAAAERDHAVHASTDELTGLLNRRGLIENATGDLEHLGLVYLDVDHFKVMNDVHGHAFGDQLLVSVARRLQELPPPIVAASRLGGDEFALAFRYHADAAPSATAAARQRVESVFAAPFILNGRETRVTASAGLVSGDDLARSSPASASERLLELIRCADIAQYYAKAEGGNRSRQFSAAMSRELERRQDILDVLERVGTTDELWFDFQAVVALSSGEVAGAEALARMRTATLGKVSPGEFIPLAERNGCIAGLGRWAIDTVLDVIETNQQRLPPGFRIAVNLSPLQLQTPGFFDRLQALADSRGCLLKALRLEITESALVDDGTIRELARLKAAGFQLAIDDFGSEYASLRYLGDLEVDVLKLDQSFTARIVTQPASRTIVRNVLSLARDLDIAVVTEGVETVEQRDILADMGCAYGQGYLWDRPAPGIDRLLDGSRL